MRRPRMTTRRWMVAVAVVALVLGVLLERRARFLELSAYYRSRIVERYADNMRLRNGGWVWVYHDGDGNVISREEYNRPHAWNMWCVELAAKYEEAASRPWLPVAPDPPAPE